MSLSTSLKATDDKLTITLTVPRADFEHHFGGWAKPPTGVPALWADWHDFCGYAAGKVLPAVVEKACGEALLLDYFTELTIKNAELAAEEAESRLKENDHG